VKTLHLIRHGQTKENLQKIWQGHSETSLDSTGLKQAVQSSNRLNNFSKVFSSDLKRALDTAHKFSNSIEKRKQLREVDVGNFAGEKVSETYTNNRSIFDSL